MNRLFSLLADVSNPGKDTFNPSTPANPFGTVNPPGALSKFGTLDQGAIGKFLNLILNLLIVGAGIYALINLVIAGYSFMSAGDDPKKVAGAWARIWQTLMGLAFTAGAFVLAAIFGKVIFNDWGAIINPTIKTLSP